MSDHDVRRELEFHIEQQAQALSAQGFSKEEAQRRARLQFGGIAQVNEACREIRRWRLLDEVRDDVRFALRLARRTPSLTAVTLLALALGIGASSTIFAVVNGILLKPLPYARPDRLVMVWNKAPRDGGIENTISPADFLDFVRRNRTLERLDGYFSFLSPLEVSLGDRTEVAYAQVVTPGLFDTLGRTAARGRTFRTGVYAPEVVLSYGYWRRRFAEDPSVVGRAIRIGNQPATIVGVMPADLVFPYPGMLGPSGFTRVTNVDVWASMAFSGPMAAEQRTTSASGEVLRNVRFLGAVGREKPGVSLEQVRTDLASVAQDLGAEHPESNAGWGVIVTPARDQTVGKIRPALILLFGGVGLVLMMATVNVANLMLSRSLERRSEYATRAALGAGRPRMLRQSVVESLLLSAAGGVLGLAAGLAGIRLLTRFAPADLPRLQDIAPDWRMVAATIAMAIVVGVLIGLLPALGAASTEPQRVLREHARGATGSRLQRRYRTALMIGQVALACVLTIGAALLLRSFASVMSVDAGFKPEGLLTWQMNLPDRLRTADERRAFYRDFFDRVQRLPGVLSVGGTTRLPLGSTSVTTTIEIQGRPATDATRPEVEFRRALHRYFETMEIPLVEGRGFDSSDGPGAPPVVLVNRTLARRFFPGETAVGKYVRTGGGSWMEIVGVIGDIRHTGLEQAPAPELYINYLQNPPVAPFIVIRAAGDPAALAETVRAEAQRIDADLPLYDMRTMRQVRSEAVAQRRFVMGLVTLFGAIALILAAIGIDGVVAVAVNERMPEMSVRLALGAEPAQLWRTVVAQSARTASYGIGAGLVLTWLMAMPFIREQLFGVQPADPLTIAGVVVLFFIVAVAAALVPAHRAAHADPVRALRGVQGL